jgi:hypothetical protein
VNDPATVAQVKVFSEGGIALIGVLREHFPSTPKTGGKESSLADYSRWILGATLALPLVWELAAQIARTAILSIKTQLLDRAASIQNDVFQLRRKAIDFLFVTLFGIGSKAFEWLVITRAEVMATLALYGTVTSTYLSEMHDWIKTTGREVKTFADDLLGFIRGLGDYLDMFMSVDFGSAVSYGLPIAPFSLNDILEWRDDPSKAEDIQDSIDDFILLSPLISLLIIGRLLAFRDMIGILATNTPFPDEAAPPDISGITFPNVYDEFFGGPEAKKLRESLAAAGPALTTAFDKIFSAGITALTSVSDTFGKAGEGVKSLGSVSRYRLMSERATALAETAFGADAMRAGLKRRKDPIAEAFEEWLGGSGFTLVGKALPRYVAEMIQFWKKEAAKPPGERPTSPHITAARARLGRVRVPRLVIRVGDPRDLDKTLAVELADRAGVGVAQAFQTAVTQLAAAG